MAAFVFRKAPEDLPEVKFQDATGQGAHARRLARQGRAPQPVGDLVPALPQGDAGARPAAAGDGLATSSRWWRSASTARGWPGARKFLDETKVEKLALYADGTARMATTLRAAGLPATLLLDRQGREIGRLLGPAEWDSEDAKRLIRCALK